MPKYEIRTSSITLINGQTVTPEDVLAVVELQVDADPRDVLSMVQFRSATLVCIDAPDEALHEADLSDIDDDTDDDSEGDDSGDDDDDDGEGDGDQTNPFSNLNAKQQESLAVEGVMTLAQAALYLGNHETFEKLKYIGPETNLELVELIREAGLPVPEKY